jgi:hypothetical protein
LNTHLLTVFVRAQKDQEKMRVLPLRATTALLATLLVAASFQDLTVAAGKLAIQFTRTHTLISSDLGRR